MNNYQLLHLYSYIYILYVLPTHWFNHSEVDIPCLSPFLPPPRVAKEEAVEKMDDATRIETWDRQKNIGNTFKFWIVLGVEKHRLVHQYRKQSTHGSKMIESQNFGCQNLDVYLFTFVCKRSLWFKKHSTQLTNKKKQRAMSLALWLVVTKLLVNFGDCLTWGWDDCPCMNESSREFGLAKEIFQSESMKEENRSEDYGLTGCKQYNGGECEKFPYSCHQEWCYVDMDKCQINEAKCGNDKLGSFTSGFCRQRPVSQSRFNDSLYFSYETCNNLGSYDEGRFKKWMSGVRIQAATDKLEDYPHKFHRALVAKAVLQFSFLKDDYNYSRPKLEYRFEGENDWCTKESKETVNNLSHLPENEWSYCVHDVAVGNTDLCVADVWVTPERSAIAQFLPPVRFSNFYLVQHPVARTKWNPIDILKRPFLPFHWTAWLGIVCFIGVSILLLLIGRCMAGETLPAGQTLPMYPTQSRRAKVVMAAHDVMRGQDAFTGQDFAFAHSIGCRVLSFGFGFFTMIIGSIYTANLTSMLVTESTGSIGSLNDAKGMHVCVHKVPYQQLNTTYKDVNWTSVDNSSEIPRKLKDGTCEAAIMDDLSIDQMHAGFFAENCHEGRSACDERKSFDCEVERVSPEVQLTLPVSFPVGPAFAHPLGWALTKLMSNGTAKELDKNPWKVSKCRSKRLEGQLDFVDIFGTMIIATLLMLPGAMLYFFCYLPQRWQSRVPAILLSRNPPHVESKAPLPQRGKCNPFFPVARECHINLHSVKAQVCSFNEP